MRLRLCVLVGSFAAAMFACSLATDTSGLADPALNASPDTSSDAGDAATGAPDAAVDATASDGPDPALTYPATPVLDDFERSDGPLGASWTAGAPTSYPGRWVVESTKARYIEQDPGGGCGGALSIWSQPFGSRQEVFATLRAVPSYGTIALRAKMNASETAEVVLSIDVGAGTAQVSAGSPTANVGASFKMILNASDRIGMRAHPDGLVEIFRNGVVIAQRTWSGDTSSGGRLAIEAYCAGNVAGTVLDDFGGGDVP